MKDLGYRQFWLENENGERIGLNGEHEWILLNPTGLGWSSGISDINIKHGFFAPSTEDAPEQQSVVGDLVFHGSDPYTQYRFFADWVLKAKTLYLLYMPRTTVYKRRVRLAYLTKTEIAQNGALAIPISFTGLTPWYVPSMKFFPEITPDEEDGPDDDLRKIGEQDLDLDISEADDPTKLSFKYLFFDHAGSVFGDTYTSSSGNATIHIEPNGQMEGALRFTVDGPSHGITVKIVGDNSLKTYGTINIPVDVYYAQHIDYSSEPGDSHILLVSDSGSVQNLIDQMDLTVDIYPRLPNTEPYTITFDGVPSNSAKASVIVQEYLMGV